MHVKCRAGGLMRHCCKFNPEDVYYLKETNLYVYRMFSIGFCPICQKPVAEIYQFRFDGVPERISWSGIEANDAMIKYSGDILYSMKEINLRKFKSKPYGWRYGVNRSYVHKKSNKEIVRQYACDFYGNKELIKSVS